jgi:hypothetical protein
MCDCRLNTPLYIDPQGSFRLGIDEYVKQREAKVMERLEGGGDVSVDAARMSELSPTRLGFVLALPSPASLNHSPQRA